MIVVTGRIQVPAENRERFIEVATAMCSASRQEHGCEGYRFYADLEQVGRYVLVEEWEDDPALQRHFAQAHTMKFMSDLTGLLGGPPDVLFHTVASTRRLDPSRGLIAFS